MHPTEKFSQRLGVTYVRPQELEIASPTDFFKVGSFPLERIELIEIIHNRKFRALAEKTFSDVRANEARPASQKHAPRLVAQFPSYVRSKVVDYQHSRGQKSLSQMKLQGFSLARLTDVLSVSCLQLVRL